MTRSAQTWALAVSLAWMALVMIGAAVAADLGLVSRPAAVIQWFVAGVLPPALALAMLPAEERPVRRAWPAARR